MPAAPITVTESVFVEVAAPHATGEAPKRICPPDETLMVASVPGSRRAVTTLVVAS